MRGMTLHDFKAFLKENEAPHSRLQVIMMGKEPFDMLTVIDEQKYERMRRNHKASWGSDVDDWVETGHTYNDYMRMCWIVNIGYHSGSLPLVGGEGVYNEERGDWDIRPARGIKQALVFLLKEGCLRPTRAVAKLGEFPGETVKGMCDPISRLYGDF